MKSWNFFWQRYPPPGSREYEFKLDNAIVFNTGSNDAELVQGWGWSPPEKNFTWTNGKMASLVFPIEAPEQDLILTVKLHPFIVPGKLDHQQVNVIINDKPIDQWLFSEGGQQEKTILIPKDLLSQGKLNIVFETPDAKSPKELGISEDARELAIAIYSMTMNVDR